MKTTWSVLLALLLPAAPAAVQAQFTYTTNNGAITLSEYTGRGGAVVISNFVNIIGDWSFYDGISPSSVTVPGSVTNIGEGAFYECASLAGVTISNGVINIEEEAFSYCASLAGVTIPGSVATIGEWAFYGCTNLSSLTISNGVAAIGEEAFEDCPSLTGVTIPGSVATIGEWAFYGCTNLSSLTISNGVAGIEEGAFDVCPSLGNVTIPASVTSIGDYAFADCPSLTAITVDKNNAFYSSSNGVLFDNSQTTLLQFPGGLGGSYTIQGSVTSIETGAFLGCAGLAGVTIPASVNSIGQYAFAGCTSLTGAFFQGNAPAADSTVFQYDSKVTVYYLTGTTWWDVFAAYTGLTPVLWNPLIQTGGGGFGVQGGQFEFTIAGTAGIPIVVEACTNLGFPVWVPLQTNTLTGGSWSFSEPFRANSPTRFYRIRSP
jgi:hypothetical protein